MMVAQKVHTYIKRAQLLCGTVDAFCNGMPIVMFHIIRYNTQDTVALLGCQTNGKHIRMIVYLIKHFLNLLPAGSRNISPIVQHAVHSSGRNTRHAGNVFNGVVLVFHILCLIRFKALKVQCLKLKYYKYLRQRYELFCFSK